MARRLLPETTLRGHTGEVQSLAYTQDERLLLSGDSVGVVRMWDLQTARSEAVVQAHSEDAGVLQVRVHHNDVITQGRDGQLSLWDLTSESSLRWVRSLFKSESYHFCQCCIPSYPNPDALHGNTVATAGMNNRGAQLVDWRDGASVMQCDGTDDHGMSMCLNMPDTEQAVLLAGTEGGHIVCWDLRKPLHALAHLKIADEPTFAIDCTRGYKTSAELGAATQSGEDSQLQSVHERTQVRLVCGGAYRSIIQLELDVALGRLDCAIKTGIPEEGIGDVSMRCDNRILAAGCWDSCVRLFHVRTGKKLAVLKQHRASIAAVQFGKSGQLVCASRDKSISIWEIAA